MRILAVTGRLAEKDVRRAVKGYDCDVYVTNVDVAAFITPSHLKDIDLNGYDLVLVPGLARGDWEKLERERGVKIRLGPIHAADLAMVLRNIDRIELSHETPACRLLNAVMAEENISAVDGIEDYAFEIGSIKVGRNSRMKVVAEIVDAPVLSRDELIQRIEYYLESGADIVDIGIPLECDVDSAVKSVKVALDYCNAVSVDTFSEKIIEACVKAGVHMVMSVGGENIRALEKIGNAAVVVVERDVGKLVKLVEFAKKHTEKVIADCILDAPLKTAESIMRYIHFRQLDAETPLLFGVGNVTELSDADSIGMNALLAFMAEEIGVDLLFTTEASPKTRGCIRELRVASYMAKAAKLRRTPPKDLGFNLLALKEKVIYETCKPENAVEAKPGRFERDPMGDFRIWIYNGKVVCSHEKLTVVGDAKSIADTVIAKGLVSRLDHAAYLGRELKKAEIAAMLGKNYVQDAELNFGIYTNANQAHP
ncbi:dihydropteroate synthase-like protein [Archaeoglobus veneficus]|uniref:Dihydropteroate synthase-related protein n=1 Tax=Archaeoglobus veneficus (strain DSM 11195 / SNP6) TaxID=693661 RepID=F2KQ52_ARCVS|nr:dihydropteroate synthase-like protein [Archaeoglobus veneficus]AEA47655.1 dihydropteroate synthase-related protein [Archaeoglobus veneficus SNP6]